jgi:hypothetical protein
MDKYGKTPDNSKNQIPEKVEKVITQPVKSTLSSIQFGHLRTVRDKKT